MNKMDCALMVKPLERYLRAALPKDSRKHFRRVLDRDETLELDFSAGANLVWMSNDEMLGPIVLWLYWRYRAGDCSVKIYRDALDSAWAHDHRTVVGVARDRRQLRAMFRIVEFPVPEHLPEVVDIWRGTGGITLDRAGRGISWSTDRDVACWFACEYFRTPTHDPLVMRVTVAKNDLIVPYNDRDKLRNKVDIVG